MTQELSSAARNHIYNVIIAGPFGTHVGLSVDEAVVDRVVIRMHGAPHVMNALGIVHGGATATLIDTAATAAAWATPQAQTTTRGTTVAMTINYLSGGEQGDLIAEGRVVSRGGTLTVVDVIVHDQKGRAVAKGQITYKLDLARDRRMARG
jgi:1,4-dihydroxy-2-naphthoyl-CoA hydrolase